MKNFLLPLILFVFSYVTAASKNDYDVIIYGGTSAGVVAAYQVKKLGKSVLLIAPDGHIGGLSSGGLGETDIGNKQVIGGMSRDFYRKLGSVYGKEESWKFEPKEALKIFLNMISEQQIDIIKLRKIKSVGKAGNKITSLTLVNTYGKEVKLSLQTVKAAIFLDCSYEGDLFAKAGVSYALGRERNEQYGETINGYSLPDYLKQSGRHQFPDSISPYKIPGIPSSGLLYGISTNKPSKKGHGDQLIQAYNFRICLTKDPANAIPITKPENYNAENYELLIRLIEKQPTFDKLQQYFIWSLMPNNKTDINNRGGFSTDMIGANHNWPEADFDERQQIFNEHVAYTKGLLYFFKTDPRIPKSMQDAFQKYGYPKDEYFESNHWSPQLYVREGRRMIGSYVMTEKNCLGTEVVTDPIAMAAYAMDSHNTQRIVIDGMVKNEGNVEVKGFKPYPISYQSIVPTKLECTNLLVPVSLSASHIAFGSIRMEPVFMILGQSAAIAAVQAIKENKAVQDIDYATLKPELMKHKQILHNPE